MVGRNRDPGEKVRRPIVGRRAEDGKLLWECEHPYPIAVETIEEGQIARCLLCGKSGSVSRSTWGALHALRDRAPERVPRKASP